MQGRAFEGQDSILENATGQISGQLITNEFFEKKYKFLFFMFIIRYNYQENCQLVPGSVFWPQTSEITFFVNKNSRDNVLTYLWEREV